MLKKFTIISLLLFSIVCYPVEKIVEKDVCKSDKKMEVCNISGSGVSMDMPVTDEQECKKFFYYLKQFHLKYLIKQAKIEEAIDDEEMEENEIKMVKFVI